MNSLPPTPEERIADALEYFKERMPICGHGNIEVFCNSCKTINLEG